MKTEKNDFYDSGRVVKTVRSFEPTSRFLFNIGKTPTKVQVERWEDDGGLGDDKGQDFEIIEGSPHHSILGIGFAKFKKFFHEI